MSLIAGPDIQSFLLARGDDLSSAAKPSPHPDNGRGEYNARHGRHEPLQISHSVPLREITTHQVMGEQAGKLYRATCNFFLRRIK